MDKTSRRPWTGGFAALSMATLLVACDSEAPAPATATPTPAQVAAPIEDELTVMGPARTVLAFGDSLFAGYNLAEDEGYPERLEGVLRRRGIDATVIDAGVSGDTTAAGRQRIAYVLDNLDAMPDLAIVELGGNDLLRGIQPSQTRENLTAILDELKSRGVPVMLMGMRAPPNYGPQYQADFDALYPALAAQYDAALVPFFMAPLLDNAALVQDDRIHPTAQGVEAMVAATVDTVIEALPKD
ncbi:arylesterase [Erythrobacter arachoides]|uniref:Arylesterase n=2 Tax=Aurantiacibacter arachoides TaxID=1850444 RepID=A0A844ZYI3_9SPHN|nr:arylesterase [Aurantiacibacter arachoides]